MKRDYPFEFCLRRIHITSTHVVIFGSVSMKKKIVIKASAYAEACTACYNGNNIPFAITHLLVRFRLKKMIDFSTSWINKCQWFTMILKRESTCTVYVNEYKITIKRLLCYSVHVCFQSSSYINFNQCVSSWDFFLLLSNDKIWWIWSVMIVIIDSFYDWMSSRFNTTDLLGIRWRCSNIWCWAKHNWVSFDLNSIKKILISWRQKWNCGGCTWIFHHNEKMFLLIGRGILFNHFIFTKFRYHYDFTIGKCTVDLWASLVT